MAFSRAYVTSLSKAIQGIYHDDPEEMLRDSGEMVILKAVPGDEPESEEYEEIQDDNEYEDVAAVFADRLQDLFEIEDE